MTILGKPLLHVAAVAFEIYTLLLGVILFHNRPNALVFEQFNRMTHIHLTGDFFAILCAFGAVGSLFTLFIRNPRTKQQHYLVCASPLILYAVPLAVYSFLTGGSIYSIWTYTIIYFAFLLIAFGVFRGDDNGEPNAPTSSPNN